MESRPHLIAIFLILQVLAFGCRDAEIRPGNQVFNAFQLITGVDTDEEQKQWDQLYQSQNYVYGTRPNPSLATNLSLLPAGRTLLFPMEEGRNAVFLARHGHEVYGVDFSEFALRKAKHLARDNKVSITGINADLNKYEIERGAYDLIVDLDFHRTRLVDQIRRGLRKGGVVFYEAYLHGNTGSDTRGVPLAVRDQWLQPGALKEYFKDFQILVFRERTDINGRPIETIIAKKLH